MLALSFPYNRCHTSSWLTTFTSTGDIPILLRYVVNTICVPQRLIFREIYPHTGLESTTKSFNDASFGLFVVCTEITDAFFFQKSCNCLFRNSFPLSVCIFCGSSLFLSRRRNDAVSEDADLFLKGVDQAFFREHASDSQKETVAVVVPFQKRHVD